MENLNPSQNQASQFKGKGALDAFLNLLGLITVGWMSIAIGMILFQIINKFFTDKAIDYVARFSQGPLKFGIASAVILTPIFLAVSAWLHRNYKMGKLNHQSGIHRWLTYLMLLVSALTIIGRLIYQLFRFLDGDYAMAVILKTLVILAIAGGIFGYYLYDLVRRDFSKKSSVSILAMSLVIVVALASVIGGFIVIDSPATSRSVKFDEQRVNDLTDLDNRINLYYKENQELPEDLSAPRFSQFKDPVTDQPYEYQILGEEKFELCAIFDLKANTEDSDYRYYADRDWYYHEAGRQCFETSVLDQDLKPVPIREPEVVY